MQLDLDQVTSYERRLAEQLEILEKAKRMAEHYRLQIKETKRAAKLARQDATIKAFIRELPKDHVTVTPSPGLTYVSCTLTALQGGLYRDVPDILGLKLLRDEEVEPGRLLGPRVRVFRSPHSPGVHFYITTHLR